MKLSIVIPIYNEAATILDLLNLVDAVAIGMDKEFVLVDDCSKDGTRDVLKKVAVNHPTWQVLFHEVNQGKGAACEPASLRPQATSSSFRMPTWSTIPGSIQSCSAR